MAIDTKEITKIIKEQLPAQVGELLQEELAELARLRKLTKIQEQQIDAQEVNIKQLTNEISKYHDIESREAELIRGEEALLDGSRSLGHREQLVELKEKMLEQRNHDLKEIVTLVFQNNRYKHTKSGMIPVAVPNDGGSGWVNHETTSETTESEF